MYYKITIFLDFMIYYLFSLIIRNQLATAMEGGGNKIYLCILGNLIIIHVIHLKIPKLDFS